LDSSYPECVAASGEFRLRGESVPLPGRKDYGRQGIELDDEQPWVFELCRYLAATRREDVLASPEERRISVLPEMTQILQLEEWHHPDVAAEDLPSESATFEQLAEVLATGDITLYRPSEAPNTHWSNWPEGGLL